MFTVGTQGYEHWKVKFIGSYLWRPTTPGDHLCSPTVHSGLEVAAVDGVVAHDIVFSGLL